MTTAQPDRLPLAALLLAASLAGCGDSNGDDGNPGKPGPAGPPPPTSTVLLPTEDAPGVNLEILALDGGSGDSDLFNVGDTMSVTFSVTKDSGDAWDLEEMSTMRILVGGPSYNYQLVIPQAGDVITASEFLGDGTYKYTFATPIPDVFPPPLNDTDTFGADDGELQGEPLPGGTYTVGMYGEWTYTVGSDSFDDVGNAELDFALGAAGPLAPRELVTDANCNQCHVTLQAHGSARRDTKLCLLCHTAGAEDKNVASVAGGTPDVTIDFKVMIHQIHNGEHLASVLGVTTDDTGARVYDAKPEPLQIVGFQNSIHDFSEVAFPVWPSLTFPMPRDEGYSALTATQQSLEDEMRRGVVSCDKCHGDPDGDGPLAAPAQGDLIYSQPSRKACGSCHADVVWENTYISNGQPMGPQLDDSSCKFCHTPSGDSLAVEDAHLHPMLDPGFNPGLNFDVTALVEAGKNDGDGTVDPGEKIAITFTVKNDAGTELATTAYSNPTLVINGPTSNPNVLLNQSVGTGMLTGSQPYTIDVPEIVLLEWLGDSSSSTGDVFQTARTPVWNVSGVTPTLRVVTAVTGGTSSLSAAAAVTDNYVDVDDATDFAHNDYVVLDAGTPEEEYLQVQGVDGDRLWFGSLASSSFARGCRFDHAAGATVQEVTVASKTILTDYTLDTVTGAVQEVTEFGDGAAVLLSYTSDFIMPDIYPQALNDSPENGETWGNWRGKSLVAGTYTLTLYSSSTITLTLFSESNSYRATAVDGAVEFLAGSATDIEPHELISSGDNCLECHNDVYAHGGGRRNFDVCIACHGTAGGQDRPQYVAANAPATPELSIEFRNMLHKIHMGAELTKASEYEVVGFGSPAWPDNFGLNTYEAVEFPALPGMTKHCEKCHGTAEAWMEPTNRDHPTEQGVPVHEWKSACGSCHDSDAAAAHIDVQTSSGGAESCGICHGTGKDEAVEIVHKNR